MQPSLEEERRASQRRRHVREEVFVLGLLLRAVEVRQVLLGELAGQLLEDVTCGACILRLDDAHEKLRLLRQAKAQHGVNEDAHDLQMNQRVEDAVK